jgi:hypothetical protein
MDSVRRFVPKFHPARLRSMTSTQVGWVAGLLEGEGSFIVTKQRGLPRVQMQSTDHDVLLRLQAVLGRGHVTNVGIRGNRKRCWGFSLMGLRDVESLLLQIYPLMGERRRGQIDNLLQAIDHRMAA